MVRNITVGISDDIAREMAQLHDVNWSAVTRECIKKYIKQRTSVDIETIIPRIKAIYGEDFGNGYAFVLNSIDKKKISLVALEEIAHPHKKMHEKSLIRFLGSELAETIFSCDLPQNSNQKNPSNIRYKVSAEFIHGMQEAARELLERSK